MKYEYNFVTGTKEVEIDEKWASLLNEMDEEYDKRRDSSFRPTSIEVMEIKGYSIPIEDTDILKLITESTEKERALQLLPEALSTLNPKQQALIKAIYFDGLTQAKYAEKLGVSQSAVSQRLSTAEKILKKFLEKTL